MKVHRCFMHFMALVLMVFAIYVNSTYASIWQTTHTVVTELLLKNIL